MTGKNDPPWLESSGLVQGPERFFARSLAVLVLVKVALALIVPLTGDEAYFLLWGTHLDFGYYDHPPMIGWIIALLSHLGDHLFLYRLFPLVTTVFIGIAIYRLLRDTDRVKACLVALVFLLSPAGVLNVIVSTDTPLILFVFLAGMFFARGIESDSTGPFVLSGLFLGLSFLSKYFAVLLLAAFAAAALVSRSRRLARNVAVVAFVALPFAAVNLYWNYTNCWANILFNLIARPRDSAFDFARIFSFLAMQVYLLMPWTLYFVVKHRDRYFSRGARPPFPYYLYYGIPLMFFLFLSVRKSIGMHWMASFLPFFFVMLSRLDRGTIARILKYTFIFGLAHVLLVGSALLLPHELFRNHRKYNLIRLHLEPGDICEDLSRYSGDYLPASNSYSLASVLSYHCREDFIVFRSHSKYGRAGDKFTDFRDLEGKDIVLLSARSLDRKDYAPFFDNVEVVSRNIGGAPYTLVFGEGFRFEGYRDFFLADIRDRYYRIPDFLPCGACYFLDRYF